MTAALKVGLAGAFWAVVSGLSFLIWLLLSPGFTTSVSFWMVTSVLVSIVFAGILSVLVIVRLQGRPHLASSLIWTATGIIITGCILGAGVWDIFVVPACLLIIPAAFTLASGKADPGRASLGFAGSIWAAICGALIFSIVALPFLLRGQRWPQLMIPAATIVIAAILSLTAVAMRNKMPLVSAALLWTGILGVSTPLFLGLAYFSIYLFPALLMLVLSALRWREKTALKSAN